MLEIGPVYAGLMCCETNRVTPGAGGIYGDYRDPSADQILRETQGH